jgi:LytS/YehU family sensor histidine kinase
VACGALETETLRALMVSQVVMYATNTGMGAGNMKLTLACACVARMLMMIVIVMVAMAVVIALVMVVMTGLPDMIELIRLNAVVIFTCANDYADVKVRIPATFSRELSRASGRDAPHAGSESPV